MKEESFELEQRLVGQVRADSWPLAQSCGLWPSPAASGHGIFHPSST